MTAQRVIVTAAGSGIGLSIAQRFLAAGACVAICDQDPAAVNRTVTRYPTILGRALDVSSETAVRAFVDDVVAQYSGIDVLINNAGVAGACAELDGISADQWIRSFDVNVHASFYFIKAVIAGMKAQGGGAIINISTGSVFSLPAGRSDYIASKWALEGLTRAAARELGPFGIRVNAIRPGFVNSARMRGILTAKARANGRTLEEVEREFLNFISMRTKVEPEEIGDTAVFLGSSAARHITGQLFSVDGNIEWEA